VYLPRIWRAFAATARRYRATVSPHTRMEKDRA
jgi:hypothetical protein